MEGAATFTFSFSVGLCDFEYSVGVAHTVEGGFGPGAGPQSAFLLNDGQSATEFAAARPALVQRRATTSSPPRPKATVERRTKCMSADWSIYRTYFDDDL
jgi:hypothetical protein